MSLKGIEYIFTAPAQLMENAAKQINKYQTKQKKEPAKKSNTLEKKTDSIKEIPRQPTRFRRFFRRR